MKTPLNVPFLFASLLWAVFPAMVQADHGFTVPEGRSPAVWLGPESLDPTDSGIGRRIPDQVLSLADGEVGHLHQAGGKLGTVVVVRDPQCPVSRRYGPRIAKLAKQYGAAGFAFVFIYVNQFLEAEELADDARMMAVRGWYVAKGSFTLAHDLAVKSTGDVFVLDAEHRLQFRGAVDDQFGFGYTKDFPTRLYLRNALDAVRDGRPVEVPATTAPGCFIDADPAKDRLFQPAVSGEMLS